LLKRGTVVLQGQQAVMTVVMAAHMQHAGARHSGTMIRAKRLQIRRKFDRHCAGITRGLPITATEHAGLTGLTQGVAHRNAVFVGHDLQSGDLLTLQIDGR
jgi:hypothetical protein